MTVSSQTKILLCERSGRIPEKKQDIILGTASLHSAFSSLGHLPAGTWSRPLTPKGSPLSNRLSPRTLKRSRVTTSLQALPTGTELTDQNGKHWTLGALQTRDDQGILYEGTHCPSAQDAPGNAAPQGQGEYNTQGPELQGGKMGEGEGGRTQRAWRLRPGIQESIMGSDQSKGRSSVTCQSHLPPPA